MLSRLLLIIACLGPGVAGAQSLPWQQMELVGEARLNFLFWQVYEARLFSAEDSFSYPDTTPFALVLQYKREFTREDLVSETRRQWEAIGVEVREDWLGQLEKILTNVGKNDEVALYVDQTGRSSFYFNERLIGEIADPGFGREFAAIWLSEKTTRPGFREDLLRSI